MLCIVGGKMKDESNIGFTLLCDPMFDAIVRLSKQSPIFNEFIEEAMITNQVLYIQNISKMILSAHVSDYVLDEFYRHMGI
jgi:hypothetical protein